MKISLRKRRLIVAFLLSVAIFISLPYLCMQYSLRHGSGIMRRLLRKRRLFVVGLLFVAFSTGLSYLCMQYSLVSIDDGRTCIVVKWIDVPYKEDKSLFSGIIDKLSSSEAKLFRSILYSYSLELMEINYSCAGVVFLYSVFARNWGECGAAGADGVKVSLCTGQMLTSLVDGEIRPAGDDKECYAWNGVTTECCKVTAQNHRRQTLTKPKRLSVKQCTINDCWSLNLGENDVFVVFDKSGLFVRSPGSFAFRGYRWKFRLELIKEGYNQRHKMKAEKSDVQKCNAKTSHIAN